MTEQSDMETGAPISPQITRMRHELHRRNLKVASSERLTPHMIRLTLEGSELEGFVSAAPDDHFKLFVPDGEEGDARRDYTPRLYKDGRLTVDVVDHPGGPAADWARLAATGDSVMIGGPRGSVVIGGDIRHWVLIGDETALPAIGRRIEELPAESSVMSIVAVPGPEDEQQFETAARHDPVWLHRPLSDATEARPYIEALEKIDLPPQTFVWVAAEAAVAREIRSYLLDRGHDLQWIKASGYWIKGQADASDKSIGE